MLGLTAVVRGVNPAVVNPGVIIIGVLVEAGVIWVSRDVGDVAVVAAGVNVGGLTIGIPELGNITDCWIFVVPDKPTIGVWVNGGKFAFFLLV